MLSTLVRRSAGEAPDRPVVISPSGRLTYSDCLRRAEAVSFGLREREILRFGCLLSVPETVIALTASTIVASEACVYPRDPGAGGYARLVSRFAHRTVISDQPALDPAPEQLPLAALEQHGDKPADSSGPFPVLILTTGTTGEQKGARHDWQRLLAAVRHQELRPGTRWLLAYNINQFAGIQVLLHVLAGGGTLVEPASRQAEDVIEAIRQHGVTHVSATPTFWRLLAGRIDAATAEALPLEQITLGGEAAPEELLDRLSGLFPTARISHVYAGTEFGSAISIRDGHSGLPVSALDRDESSDAQLRIVDGELQVRSRVGMLGYYESDQRRDDWVRTGDLVEVRDGRIHFVGRTTEIINVGGAKIHPLPVEDLICSVEGVQLAAVYGRPSAVTGQIVAADVVPAPGTDTTELEPRIRSACQALPAAARPRRVRFVADLDIRGNKLMRHEAR